MTTLVEKDVEQAIGERDTAQEAVSEIYRLVVGAAPEWSNLFGYGEAIRDIKVAIDNARREERERCAASCEARIVLTAGAEGWNNALAWAAKGIRALPLEGDET